MHIITLCVACLMFFTTSKVKAISQPCDGIQNYFVDGINNSKSGVITFVYKHDFSELTKLSGNDGSSGSITENLEEVYLELLARIELSRYLQTDVTNTVDTNGNQVIVSKINQNPFSLNFVATKICQYEQPFKTLLFVGRIK